MILPITLNTNRGGIPAVRSTGVTVTATQVQFDFNNHPNVGAPFRGLVIISLALAVPANTTGTLPVVFTSNGGNPSPLTGYNGAAITAADIKGTGVYLVWHESQTNTLLLITSI